MSEPTPEVEPETPNEPELPELPEEIPAEPTVEVAGLIIPASLAIRIIGALRGVYWPIAAQHPDNDDLFVQSALMFWITENLEAWESRQAEAPMVEEVTAVRDRFQREREKAARAAREAAERIIKKAQREAEEKAAEEAAEAEESSVDPEPVVDGEAPADGSSSKKTK